MDESDRVTGWVLEHVWAAQDHEKIRTREAIEKQDRVTGWVLERVRVRVGANQTEGIGLSERVLETNRTE